MKCQQENKFKKKESFKEKGRFYIIHFFKKENILPIIPKENIKCCDYQNILVFKINVK